MTNRFLYRKLALLAFVSACVCALPYFSQAAQQEVPSKSLILGVPYISWNQASQMEYRDKSITNPSMPAARSMILGYWGVTELTKQQLATWIKSNEIGSLDELKEFVARGIPILIDLPLTPVSHPVYPTFAMLAAASKPETRPPLKSGIPPWEVGLCSWMSGLKMASLQWFRDLRKMLHSSKKIKLHQKDFNPLKESVLAAHRVIIGYDDDRKVLILHAPTFGPAWEVNYDAFDKMWKAMDREYFVLHPPDYIELSAQREADIPYRDRTPDERAAFHLLYGCGLSSVGRRGEAENQLSEGIAIQGISKGYRHIMLFEFARHHAERGALDEAIVTTQAAIDLLPENYRAWEYLAELYGMSGANTKQKKAAKRAEKNAKKWKKRGSASRTVARTLPSDFWIPDLRNLRGWGLPLGKFKPKYQGRREPK